MLRPSAAGNFTFSVTVQSAFARVRIDDNSLIECNALGSGAEKTCSANYDIPVPFFESGAALVYVEVTGMPGAVRAVLLYQAAGSSSAAAPVPPAWLSPNLTAAETAYLTAREAAEVGWGSWDSFDALSRVLLPSGLAATVSLLDQSSGQVLAGLGNKGMSCDPAAFPARMGLHDAGYTEIEQIWFRNFTVRFETTTSAGGDLLALLTVLGAPPPPLGQVQLRVQLGVPSTWLPRNCSVTSGGGRLAGQCPGVRPDLAVWPSADDAPSIRGWDATSFRLALPGPGSQVAFSTGSAAMSRDAIAAAVSAARQTLVASYAARGGAANNDTVAGLAAGVGWSTIYSPVDGIVAPVMRGNPWGLSPYGYVLFLWVMHETIWR